MIISLQDKQMKIISYEWRSKIRILYRGTTKVQNNYRIRNRRVSTLEKCYDNEQDKWIKRVEELCKQAWEYFYLPEDSFDIFLENYHEMTTLKMLTVLPDFLVHSMILVFLNLILFKTKILILIYKTRARNHQYSNLYNWLLIQSSYKL